MERCPKCGGPLVYDNRPAHDGPPESLAWRHADTYDTDCKPIRRRRRTWGFRHLRWRVEQKWIDALRDR